MFHRRPYLTVLLALPVACAEPGDTADTPDGVDDLRGIHAALDPCNESVPENRRVDGIPAYAQCASIQNGAIFSNNGIDTSATKMGSDWVQTQYSGGYQCTELAHRYLAFKWKVNWIPNGNAGEWCNTQPPASSGLVQSTSPVHGDLMVFAPGSCGADTTFGHVAVVDVVDSAKTKVTAVEQNQASRSPHMVSCAKCFLHVVANDGTNPGATIGSGSAGDGGTTKPVVSADAGAPSGPSVPAPRDAGKDSSTHSAPPASADDGAADDSEPAAASGTKVDASVRKDAGTKDGKTKDASSIPDDDEEGADPASSTAAAGGCSLGAQTRPADGATSWLLALAALVVFRSRARGRASTARRGRERNA